MQVVMLLMLLELAPKDTNHLKPLLSSLSILKEETFIPLEFACTCFSSSRNHLDVTKMVKLWTHTTFRDSLQKFTNNTSTMMPMLPLLSLFSARRSVMMQKTALRLNKSCSINGFKEQHRMRSQLLSWTIAWELYFSLPLRSLMMIAHSCLIIRFV